MPLGELRARIYRTTKRSDLVEKTLDAINDAIELLTAHGDFAADLVEGSVAISSSEYAQSIVISTTFTRFRKIKYLRPSTYSLYLKKTDPAKIFIEKNPTLGQEKIDVWYRAGDNLVFKLSTLSSLMLYGYYQYPERFDDESDDDDTNWFIDNMEGTVATMACAIMFEDMGNSDEAARLEAKALKWLAVHKNDKQDG